MKKVKLPEPILEKDTENSEESSYFHYPIIGEDDKKIDSLDNIDIEKVYQMKDKRSRLQTTTVINWLRSRGGKHAKKIYLYFPDELIKNIEIKTTPTITKPKPPFLIFIFYSLSFIFLILFFLRLILFSSFILPSQNINS